MLKDGKKTAPRYTRIFYAYLINSHRPCTYTDTPGEPAELGCSVGRRSVVARLVEGAWKQYGDRGECRFRILVPGGLRMGGEHGWRVWYWRGTSVATTRRANRTAQSWAAEGAVTPVAPRPRRCGGLRMGGEHGWRVARQRLCCGCVSFLWPAAKTHSHEQCLHTRRQGTCSCGICIFLWAYSCMERAWKGREA